MNSRPWSFYILRCRDRSLYSGITNDLESRLQKHNRGTGAKYTSGRRPVALVYSEECGALSDARKREEQVKRWPKAKKERLIAALRPSDGGHGPRMKSPKFTLTRARDERTVELIKTTGHKILAAWAIECAERVMPYFEDAFPQDRRPRNAIETLQRWIDTGEFRMDVIRKASLAAHAAARDVGEDSPARSAAHAAGQAVATAHVPTHAMGPAVYALQAIHRASEPAGAEAAVARESEWQYRRLLELRKAGKIERKVGRASSLTRSETHHQPVPQSK